MKAHLCLLATFAACGVLASFDSAFAQGTMFTYQGRLNTNGSPANGSFNLTFTLYNVGTGGSPVSPTVTNNGVGVTNGIFTVTVDFGSGVWNGATNWLQIGVATNGGGFNALSPRQQMTPTPYAIYAEGASAAGILGTIPAADFGGTYGNQVTFNNGTDSFDGTFSGEFFGTSFVGGYFTGNFLGSGSGLVDVWHTTGNSGTTPGVDYLGTSDNQPMEIHVNGMRASRWEPTADTVNVHSAVNVIQGSSANAVAANVQGATIGGGGALNYFGEASGNIVEAGYCTIGGGVHNTIQSNAFESTIAGGNDNSILIGSDRCTIGGGWANYIGASAMQSFIGGGYFNQIYGDFNNGGDSVISGGYDNVISTNADYSAIGGGLYNRIFGDTNDYGTGVICGGDANLINSNSWNSFIGGGQQNVIGQGSDHSFIGGGQYNNALSYQATIGGGYNNQIQTNAAYATIGGGAYNVIQTNAYYTTIGGGVENQIFSNAYNSTISGGQLNLIGTNASSSTIGGGYINQILSNSFQSTIGGGAFNQIETNCGDSTIGGGVQNQILNNSGVATIAGGALNVIQTNTGSSTISGGSDNVVLTGAAFSAIGGGAGNTNSGQYGCIPGGNANLATNFSFAAGNRAKAAFVGDFVWADSQNADFLATTVNQVSFRCAGGVVFASGSGGVNQTVSWTPGTGSWSFTSDRNAKENFKPVNARQVLEKVAQLPLTEWNYKGYGDRHVGPMAQDFHAAFPFNANDKMLNSADEAGVSLAAIQGLNEKLDEKDAEIQNLKKQNDSLAERLSELETTVKLLAFKK